MSKYLEQVDKIIDEKIKLISELKNGTYFSDVEKAGIMMADSLAAGGKILLAGNGGSAADAQHFAGEIVGRFLMERKSLPAFSLCTDPSVVTCIANDYGYDNVFARQVEGHGKSNDIFLGISTSGNSENIIRAVDVAKKNGLKTVCLLGRDGGKLKPLCDVPLVVTSNSTPRIQEIHTFTVHLLCQLIEEKIFSEKARQSV